MIVVIDGEFTVTRLYKRGGRIRLSSENSDFAPIEIKDGQELRIWGIVIHTIHQMPP